MDHAYLATSTPIKTWRINGENGEAGKEQNHEHRREQNAQEHCE